MIPQNRNSRSLAFCEALSNNSALKARLGAHNSSFAKRFLKFVDTVYVPLCRSSFHFVMLGKVRYHGWLRRKKEMLASHNLCLLSVLFKVIKGSHYLKVLAKVDKPTKCESQVEPVMRTSGKLCTWIDIKLLNETHRQHHLALLVFGDILPERSNLWCLTQIDLASAFRYVELEEASS